MQLRNMKITSATITNFSLSLMFFDVSAKNAKKIETEPQAIFGSASASLLAAQVKLIRPPVMLFIAFSTPKRSFEPPMLIAKVDGKVLPVA